MPRLLTPVWGLNWPVMKLGISGAPLAAAAVLATVPGTFSGAWMPGEALHGQDFAAMALRVPASAAVPWRR